MKRTNIGARIAAVTCGLGMAASLLGPSAAFADAIAGNSGTTEVTVTASESNISFEVPTLIAFASGADGKLIGPSADATAIKNHSIFGIHVTNMAVKAENGWTILADASKATADNTIDFQAGVAGNMQDAYAALQGGVDLSSNAAYNMTYKGSDGDTLEIASRGDVAKVTQSLSGTGSRVATITWTVSVGAA